MKIEIPAAKVIPAMLDTQGMGYSWKLPIEQGDHDILVAEIGNNQVYFVFTSQGEIADIRTYKKS